MKLAVAMVSFALGCAQPALSIPPRGFRVVIDPRSEEVEVVRDAVAKSGWLHIVDASLLPMTDRCIDPPLGTLPAGDKRVDFILRVDEWSSSRDASIYIHPMICEDMSVRSPCPPRVVESHADETELVQLHLIKPESCSEAFRIKREVAEEGRSRGNAALHDSGSSDFYPGLRWHHGQPAVISRDVPCILHRISTGTDPC